MSVAVKAWLSLALALVGAYGSYSFWRAYKAHAADAAETAPAGQSGVAKASKPDQLPPVPFDKFTFTDSEGQPFAMEQLKGKVWAASYFFATCPGFCLQMNYGIAEIAEDLQDEDITFVSFTVDPETDKPADLKEYARKLGADPQRWKFLTGPSEKIRELGQGSLKMPATKEHNDKLVLIGADGRLQGWYSTRDSNKVRQFKRKVRELLGVDEPAGKAEKKTAAEGGGS
ncbi:MAG TPA: SCO family protein [Pirellulales bacterium]|nr:SCO family protein [Pirellulales bacterium]